MNRILKLTAFKRIEKPMNFIYIFATKFISIHKHLPLQEKKKKTTEQGGWGWQESQWVKKIGAREGKKMFQKEASCTPL